MNFLVADDSVEVLECLRKFLEKEGHSVRCTGDGEEALQIFSRRRNRRSFLCADTAEAWRIGIASGS